MHLAATFKRYLFLFFVVLAIAIPALSDNLDSLKQELKKAKTDSGKVNTMNLLANELLHFNANDCYLQAHASLSLARKIKYIKGIGEASHVLGTYFSFNGGDSTLFYLNEAKKISEQLHDQKKFGSVLVTLGTYFETINDFPQSLDNYLKALDIFEKLKLDKGIASASMGVGNVFFGLSNYKKAIEYAQKSYFHFKKINSPYASWAMNNMANSYEKLGDVEKAAQLYEKSLAIKLENGDYYGAVFSIDNLGSMFLKKGELKKAIKYYEKTLAISRQKNLEKETFANSFRNLAEAYLRLKDYRNAKLNIDSMHDYSKRLNLGELELSYTLMQSRYLEGAGSFKEACLLKDKYIEAKDSLISSEVNKIVSEADAKYKTEKKQKEIEILNKDKKISDLQLQENKNRLYKQRIIIISSVGAALLLVMLVFLLFNRNKLKQKTNEKLEAFNHELKVQKHLVEEKQKEIVDSITYAKRLQQAILPGDASIKGELDKQGSDFFILYKPKDIVAGDFYFFEKKNDRLFFAAADCTGHGVPGALVSVVCSTALNRSVTEFKLQDTGRILDKTRELVLETFSKNESDVKDGMDISFASIEYTSGKDIKLNWSGANNPLWYFKKSSEPEANYFFKEIKADKQPIGKTEASKPFIQHSVILNKNDILYLFTDGYADQFGGAKGKKFKYQQLNNLLQAIINLPLNEQQQILDQKFEGWKGRLEQVDDVCIIGIRL